MRIMLTGGGTGGHVFPTLAIIEELQKRDMQLILQWVGRAGGLEQRVCERLSIPFRSLPVEGWPRARELRKGWVALKIAYCVARSFPYLKTFQPQVVLGVGGYVSLPLVWAAQRLGLPTIVHEQNKRLGMANQVLAASASRILLSYPDTLGDFPHETARVVGNPVRAGFSSPPDKKSACATLGLDEGVPVVLVCGGSQGARTLNTALAIALTQFQPREVQFIWIAGHAEAGGARRAAQSGPVRTEVFSFTEDMVTLFAAADLVVCRSGASTMAELAVMGKPSVLVPYPHAADRHQEQNARAFEEKGAAVVMDDAECSGERLVGVIRDLLGSPERRLIMGRAAAALGRSGAAEAIVDEVFSLAFEEGSHPA
jgi:UDP-N-acetylglucosamine--N-acetylmuramyl-(pentapeptide) pyrophosphoryl-undecaprenol N-acetylglucosamine transferase